MIQFLGRTIITFDLPLLPVLLLLLFVLNS